MDRWNCHRYMRYPFCLKEEKEHNSQRDKRGAGEGTPAGGGRKEESGGSAEQD